MKPAGRPRSIVGRGPRPPRPPGGSKKLPPPRKPGAPKRPPAALPSRKPPRKKAPPRPKQPRGPMALWLKILFLTLVLVIFGSGGYLYYRAQASLPQLDGSLKLTGLSAPVEVLRDPFGVPHIFGTSVEDVARATGFVHAQDRLFQMELSRRMGTGTLAEVLGEPGLSLDRRVRRLGLGLAARTELERTDPEARAVLDAYAQGVNAYLTAQKGSLPPEFQILGFQPRPWEPADSLAIVKWMSLLLSENASVELLRSQLTETVGIEAAYLLTGLAPPPTDSANNTEAGQGLGKLASLSAPSGHRFLRAGASNAWVVSGARSTTGAPLLASDPHLRLGIPSTWYEIHLSGAGLNVAGASLPGLPMVIIGHNDRIAWGVTALYADVQDHYVERINPSDPGQYAVGDVWESFQSFQETISVAGGTPVTLPIQHSRHGVVVSEQPQNGQMLALRWDAPWNGDSALALLRLNRASGWFEFTEALRTLTSPALAFVYADVEGNIGFFPAGEVPVRTGFDGTTPVDGASGQFEWQGYIPHELKPVVLNPEEGFIISANHKMVLDETDYPLGRDQLAPFRANRIAALVGSRAQLGAADFQAIQADRYDISTESLLRYVVALNVDPGDASDAQSLLRTWDGRMGGGAAPALYQAFYARLLANTFQDDISDALYSDFLDFVEMGHPGGIYAIVDDPNSEWWDNRTTPAVEDRNAIFMQSLVIIDLTNPIESAILTSCRSQRHYSMQSDTSQISIGA